MIINSTSSSLKCLNLDDKLLGHTIHTGCWAHSLGVRIPVSSPVGRPSPGEPHPFPMPSIWVDWGALMTVNLLVCALSFNTYSQTNCLTKFAKCIFWLQHFYLGKMPGLWASKDFSPFLANLPKKHQRELLIFSLVLIQLIFFPVSFLFFFLSWHPIKALSFGCQQRVSANTIHNMSCSFPLFSTKTLFLVLSITQVSVQLVCLLHLFFGWLWALTSPWD